MNTLIIIIFVILIIYFDSDLSKQNRLRIEWQLRFETNKTKRIFLTILKAIL